MEFSFINNTWICCHFDVDLYFQVIEIPILLKYFWRINAIVWSLLPQIYTYTLQHQTSNEDVFFTEALLDFSNHFHHLSLLYYIVERWTGKIIIREVVGINWDSNDCPVTRRNPFINFILHPLFSCLKFCMSTKQFFM